MSAVGVDLMVIARGGYERASRMTGNRAYRAAAGVAVGAAFFLVWVHSPT